VNDNVMAQWTNKKWFLAHVTHAKAGRYTVYFPGDGKVRRNVAPHQLRPLICPNPPLRRHLLLGKEFYYDGENDLACGRWKIRRMSGNKYRCVRMSGDMTCTVEDFDIGYVFRCVQQAEEKVRENGPAWGI
jgi:hypothetical protein